MYILSMQFKPLTFERRIQLLKYLSVLHKTKDHGRPGQLAVLINMSLEMGLEISQNHEEEVKKFINEHERLFNIQRICD